MSITLPTPRQVIAASLLLVSILSAGVVTPASAQPVGPGIDGVSIACRSLQSQADGLIAEYGDEDTTNDRRGEILDELRSIGTSWIQIGCKAAFGNIEGPNIVFHNVLYPVAPPVKKKPILTH
jgi:hypothetical protein